MKRTTLYPKLFGFAVCLLLPWIVFAQGIQVKSSGTLRAVGAVCIRINNGNFIDNGSYVGGSEKFTLSGNVACVMSGKDSAVFNDLFVSNTGGVTHRLYRSNLHNLTIYSGSKFTVDTMSAVVVSNMVRNKATVNDIVVKSNVNSANGTLIFNNNQDSAVFATVEMYSKAYVSGSAWKWQFFGIPLRTLAKYPTFVDGVNYVRKMNEAGWYSGLTADKHWIQLANGANLTSFTGYEVGQYAAKTYVFAGQLENSNFSSGKLSVTPVAQYPGQHLIGNPYTAAIDIRKLQFGSSRSQVIENTVYLYNTGSLADWTTGGSGQTSGESPGQYVGIPLHLAGSNGIPGQIPSMQAFLVCAASDNDSAYINIPYSSTGTVQKNTTKQRLSQFVNPGTRIEVTGSRFKDKMWLFTNAECTREFDNGWDAYKFIGASSAPQIFLMTATDYYQVNTVDDVNNSEIGFIAGEDVNYKLTFYHDNVEGVYPALYLIDQSDNTVKDITTNASTYSFSSTQVGLPAKARFKIVTSLDGATHKVEMRSSSVRIFGTNKMIVVDNKSDSGGFLDVYDIYGRKLNSYVITPNSICRFLTELPAGNYITKTRGDIPGMVERLILE